MMTGFGNRVCTKTCITYTVFFGYGKEPEKPRIFSTFCIVEKIQIFEIIIWLTNDFDFTHYKNKQNYTGWQRE